MQVDSARYLAIKIIVVVIQCVSLLDVWLSYAHAQDTLPMTILQVGGDDSYPPYEYLNKQGRPTGFNIDIIQAVAKVMGLRLELKLGPWDEVRNDLKQGRIDLISGMYYSDERARVVNFSEPHMLVSYAVFVRNNSKIKEIRDVTGRGVIVQQGDMGDDYVTAQKIGFPVVRVENPATALRMLAKGEQDCAILPRILGLYLVTEFELKNIKVTGPPVLQRKYCFAVKKGNQNLVGVLNEGLSIIKNIGEYTIIYNKWFGAYKEQNTFIKLAKYALWILLPMMFILVFLVIWTWLLKRSVAAKTKDLHIELTERKQTEEALVKAQSQYQTLVNTIPDLVWLKNPNGIYISCNKTFERFFGTKESVIIGKTDYDFVEKNLADLFQQYDQKAMELDSSSINEEWLTFADDGYHGLFETIKTPMRNPDELLIGVLGVARDITERKKAEDAHKLNAQRYKSSQKVGKVGNWEYDLVNDSFWGSDQTKHIYGFELEKENLTIDEVENRINGKDRAHQALIDLIEKNEPFNLEFEIQPVPGQKPKTIRSIADLIRDEKGAPIKIIGVIQDVTASKKAEKEKINLEQQLIQAQKMEAIGRLAGGVAHDFNNMLAIILGNTEIALQDLDEIDHRKSNLKEIYKAAQRSTNLTKQLLAFARKQTIDPKILNLNQVLDDMLKMLKRLIGEDIDLNWQPAQNLWSVKIDPSQVDQILANLCVNARDAIKSVGKVTIETDNISFNEAYCKEHAGFNPGDYVMMAVSDNGSGIDKKTLDKLFEPFFTTKDIGQGTGLGLATVYGIVKQNNGFINVYSEPGEGTTFKIYLPVHSEPAVSKQKNFKKTSLTGNETILLVEDEEAILRMTKMMLERLGYTVLIASTPNEAISIVEVSNINAIHLLMTDVVMPEMNGRDLSKKLLSIYPGLKCLFMSGYTANVIAHHGILDTGVQFINKPFSRHDLATKIREVLDEAKGEKF
jgi:PAS domain S-box-containing protein